MAGIHALKKQYQTAEQVKEYVSGALNYRAALAPDQGRHFICLNFTPRWQRWLVMLFLQKNKWIERGFVSFPGPTTFKMKSMANLQKELASIDTDASLRAHLEDFIRLCPLELDVKAGRSLTPLYEYPVEQMLHSLVHVVTESEMAHPHHKVRVTEKIIKPIVGLQPFVVVGNAFSLKLLRSMGFKTFSPWIDESYDEIQDPVERARAVLKEIGRLVAMDFMQLKALLAPLDAVLAHNFEHLVTHGHQWFGRDVECAVTDVLWRMKKDQQHISSPPTEAMPNAQQPA